MFHEASSRAPAGPVDAQDLMVESSAPKKINLGDKRHEDQVEDPGRHSGTPGFRRHAMRTGTRHH